MTTDELLKALAHLRVETSSLACLGCGHEHDCGIHGCAVLREAADLIERLEKEKAAAQWIPVTERLPENDSRVLAYCKDRMIHDMKWSWPQNEWIDKASGGIYLEGFVTHWVPRPEAPEVEK